MDYSKTVHLPKTSFPMKADLPKREPSILDFWEKIKVYEKMILKRKTSDKNKKYILHDGPPYANGHIHMGHALNKILKDMIVKYKSIRGFYSPYVPGWDCHGLPIEHQLMKEMKKDKHSVDRLEFRKKAADFARRWVEIQKKEFQRLGIFGDWENPYLTLTPNYEAIILRVFRELVQNKYVYRSLKPVLWCPHCETALAEAEVEYEEKESPSIYVKFPVRSTAGEDALLEEFNPLFILIWTTTPWTLPANVGLMLSDTLEYNIIHIKNKNENWVIAKNLAKTLLEEKLKMTSEDYEIKRTVKGSHFGGSSCRRVFPKTGDIEFSKCFTDANVSEEEGTGIVHIAPGHGEIDFAVGHISKKLPVISPVDDSGKFSDEVNYSEFKGLFVLKDGNKKVLELLGDRLVHQGKIQHSYPHCWRCKNPVIFRATYQWFLNVEHNDLRRKMLEIIEKVEWIPDYGKNRIRGMIEQRPDWCLSRQRLWGTPIPIFYCEKCREPLLDIDTIKSVEEFVDREGSDVWFRESPEYFSKNSSLKCKCGGNKFVKENDILDVWFDSGVSHEAVLKGDGKTMTGDLWKDDLIWPADLYLEGSDQHRGWFQTSLIPSVALHGEPPYKAVLTHGFTVDGEGKKMSKSLGNVIAPADVLKDYGADILRLCIAASDYREDIRFSKDILKGVAENYRKIRNTFRYLVGNLPNYHSQHANQSYSNLTEIDRWALMRLSEVIQTCRKAYDSYEFHKVVVALVEFCAVDCSAFYFDVLKDRLYTFHKDSPERQSAQYVLYEILSSLVCLFSPVLSFTCEEVWQVGLGNGYWTEESVFLADFPEVQAEWQDQSLKEKWDKILKMREKANLSLESARQSGQIGSSLGAKVILSGGDKLEREILRSVEKDLAAILIVSQVEMDQGEGALEITVDKAPGTKCVRCWRYDKSVNHDKTHPGLCSRCITMIQQ